MPRTEILEHIRRYVHPFRIEKGKDFWLKEFDPEERARGGAGSACSRAVAT
jgi:hypothetical protein